MSRLPMHPYDLLMLLVLVAVTIYGFVKGMAWQLASLASIVLSFFVAVHFSPGIASFFGREAPWNRCLAMLTLYLLTSAVIWLVFRVVARMIDRVKLQEFDRQAGGLFGLSKGVLLCIVITFFAVTLSEPAREAVLRSRSGYYIAYLTRHATPFLPQELRDVLGKYIDRLNANLPDPTKPRPDASGGAAGPVPAAAPAGSAAGPKPAPAGSAAGPKPTPAANPASPQPPRRTP